eukprot:c36622_g1_i1 orf=493-1065(+)
MSLEGLQRRSSDNPSKSTKSSSNNPPLEPRSIKSLLLAVSIPLILGIVDAIFNNPNQDFYKELKKPKWNPPGWLFGLAWSILYPTMGLASWLVWSEGGHHEKQKKFEKQKEQALQLYILQLFLNLLWPYFFFGLHNIKLALIDIIALDLVLILCIMSFDKVNHLASNLLKPYFAWVSFATLLTYSILTMN